MFARIWFGLKIEDFVRVLQEALILIVSAMIQFLDGLKIEFSFLSWQDSLFIWQMLPPPYCGVLRQTGWYCRRRCQKSQELPRAPRLILL